MSSSCHCCSTCRDKECSCLMSWHSCSTAQDKDYNCHDTAVAQECQDKVQRSWRCCSTAQRVQLSWHAVAQDRTKSVTVVIRCSTAQDKDYNCHDTAVAQECQDKVQRSWRCCSTAQRVQLSWHAVAQDRTKSVTVVIRCSTAQDKDWKSATVMT